MILYDEDLAYVHDAGFSGFARQAAPGILALLRGGGIRKGRVVDLGCGSGVWARRLVRAGYDVVGIDISAPMIAMARRRAPRARFIRASILRAAIPGCDAVTSLGECLSYLPWARAGRDTLGPLFSRVRAALRPGGLFLLDFAAPGRGLSGPTRGFTLGPDWAVLVEAAEDPGRRLLTRRITTFRRIGGSFRRRHEIHRLRLYGRTEIAGQLRRAGFTVRHLRGYGRMTLRRGHAALLARREET